jgi:hypothetical protein
MKVVGRDMFIGVWCFILAIISVTKWEKREDGTKPDAKQIWTRFPKFVLGFFAASILLTIVIAGVNADASKIINSDVIGPIKTLRTWCFVLCFLCIGLTTRFRELAKAGWRPFLAFTSGVIINVPLGYIFSVLVLGASGLQSKIYVKQYTWQQKVKPSPPGGGRGLRKGELTADEKRSHHLYSKGPFLLLLF